MKVLFAYHLHKGRDDALSKLTTRVQAVSLGTRGHRFLRSSVLSPLCSWQLDPTSSIRTGRLHVAPKETDANIRLISGRVLGYEGHYWGNHKSAPCNWKHLEQRGLPSECLEALPVFTVSYKRTEALRIAIQ